MTPQYIVIREGFRWSVVWMTETGDRLIEKFWTRARAMHVADHLHLAYHAGVTAPRNEQGL